MSFRLLVCIVLLLLVACVTASAATYTFTLTGCEGNYTAIGSREIEVDFGQSFSSIQSMSIMWSGSVTAGWYEGYDVTWGYGSGPETALFYAAFSEPGKVLAKYAKTPSLGGSTYPDAQNFDLTSAFGGSGTWNELLDGQVTMKIWLEHALIKPYPTIVAATGFLDGATLVLEATPVPEPSCLLSLIGGIGGMAGFIRLRRGK